VLARLADHQHDGSGKWTTDHGHWTLDKRPDVHGVRCTCNGKISTRECAFILKCCMSMDLDLRQKIKAAKLLLDSRSSHSSSSNISNLQQQHQRQQLATSNGSWQLGS